MNLWVILVFALLAYLSGSIPFGYLLVKGKTGKNIMQSGSGNIGSTNVRRVAGKKISAFTQLLDMAKGLIPVGAYLLLFNKGFLNLQYDFVYAIALATILGHNYSIFLKFKGGKGVNTTLGASVLFAPIPVFTSVAVYFISKSILKYVSASSLALAIALPVTALIISGIDMLFYYLLVCSILILFQHRSNIIRLSHGKENL